MIFLDVFTSLHAGFQKALMTLTGAYVLSHGLNFQTRTPFVVDFGLLLSLAATFIALCVVTYIACRLLDIDAGLLSVMGYVFLSISIVYLSTMVFGQSFDFLASVFLRLFLAKYYFDVGWGKAILLFLISLIVSMIIGMFLGAILVFTGFVRF